MDLDTRTVLSHLNAMGFRNITGEQLKNFTKDLRKIVKYDARMLNKDVSNKQEHERFRTATVASSAKTQSKYQREENKENEDQQAPPIRLCKSVDNSSKMWIRPRIEQKKPRNEDAVQLYQKYRKDWERFKHRMPGENNHTDLRWQIRSKMIGDC